MNNEFEKWYEGFVASMCWCLESFDVSNRPTGDKEKFRRLYSQDENGKDNFIVHMRPVPTKERANVLFGLSEKELNPPHGCPKLEFKDKSQPNYREFNVDMNNPEVATFAFLLAVRVAKYWQENAS